MLLAHVRRPHGFTQSGDFGQLFFRFCETSLRCGGLDWHDLAALVAGKGKRQAAPVVTFTTLAPRTARKQIALLAGRPTVTLQDRVRLEQLRQWLHEQPLAVRLPPDQVQWLDGLWGEAFGG